MRDYTVYLAGPITGTSYETCTNWRAEVAKKLPSYIHAVSPMRDKEYLSTERAISNDYPTPLSCQKGITARDRFDVMSRDAILVNLLGAERVSIGTVMEIAWADAMRKPIIVCMEPFNIHQHAMIKEVASFVVDNLDDAIKIAKTVLSPGV